MGKLKKHLYDNINRQYDRKNLYLLEVSKLQEEIQNATGEEKNKLKEDLKTFKANKANHPYIVKLAEFEKKEKEFLAETKVKVTKFKEEVDKTLPKKVQELEVKLFEAKILVDFYEKYVELTYEAELIYKQCKIKMSQIPAVVQFAKDATVELNAALEKRGTITEAVDAEFKKEFVKFKADEKILLNNRIKDVKSKKKEGLISKQAEENTIKQLKRDYRDRVLMKSFGSEKTYNEEIIKNKKFELKKTVNHKISTVNINVEDVRRVCPIEVEKTTPWISYLTILIPGLGQLLNKQYVKAIIMFFATIYIYMMAIPYALGYGNYRGEGVAGLISLAENGARLDRSIIFMIEGIVAIVLLVIGACLLYASFKDVNNVEKNTIKGSRYSVWVETKQTIFEDGFPYLVIAPAGVVTVFIVLIPVFTTLLLALTNMAPKTQAKFSWTILDNYKSLLTGEGVVGKAFWGVFGWTIVWTIAATTLAIALGFILAIVLNNDRIKGKALFRSIYLLPWAVPSFITILFFSIMLSDGGAVTTQLKEIFGSDFSIKNDPTMIRMTLILMQAWMGSAYVFLLSTGVLQSINKELYEAAEIDGATSIKKLTKITVPLVLFQTGPLLVGQYTFNFNNFNIIYLFNGGGPFDPTKYGNLAGSTDLLISYIFKLTMEQKYQAMGAAVTVIVSIGLMIVAYIGYKNTDAFKKE